MAPGLCQGTLFLALSFLLFPQSAGTSSPSAVRQGVASSSRVITAVQQDGKATFTLPLKLAPNVSGEVVKSVTISEEDKDILTGYTVSPFKVEPDGSTKLDISLDFFGLPGETKFAVLVKTSESSTYKIEPTFGVVGIAVYEDLRDSQGKLRMFTGPDAEVLNIPPNGQLLEISGRAFAGTSGVPRASIWFDSAIRTIPWDDDECDSLVDLNSEKKSTCSISFKSPETEIFQIRSKKEVPDPKAGPETFDIVWFGVASAIRGAGLDTENTLKDPRVSIRVQEAELDGVNRSLILAGIWCPIVAIGLLFASIWCCVYACSKSKSGLTSVSSEQSSRSRDEVFKPDSQGLNPNAYISNSVDGDVSGQWENVMETGENSISSEHGQPMAKYALREGTADALVDQRRGNRTSPSTLYPEYGGPTQLNSLRSVTTDSTTDPYTSKATSDGYIGECMNSANSMKLKPCQQFSKVHPVAQPGVADLTVTSSDRKSASLLAEVDRKRNRRKRRPPEHSSMLESRLKGNALDPRNVEYRSRLSQQNEASTNSSSEYTESTWSTEFPKARATTTSSSYFDSPRITSDGHEHPHSPALYEHIDVNTPGSPPSAQSGPSGLHDMRQTDMLWSKRASSPDRGTSSPALSEDGGVNVTYQVPDDDSSHDANQQMSDSREPIARDRVNSEATRDDGTCDDSLANPLRGSSVSSGQVQGTATATAPPNWTERWSRAVVDKFRVRRQARDDTRQLRILPDSHDAGESPGRRSGYVVAAPPSPLPISDILQDFPWGSHRTCDNE